MRAIRCLLFLLLLAGLAPVSAQQLPDRNVVFGMASGAALLMDVYRPPAPNGLGVVLISGSGWGVFSPYQRGYESDALKVDFTKGYVADLGHALVDHGYTVFMINHRFAPAFRYSTIIADAQRAVRFIRAHATDYAIDPDHLGAVGHSSGAYLAAMLGLTDPKIENPRNSPIEAQSSRVQAVVTMAAPFVMTENFFDAPLVARAMTNVMGSLPDRDSTGRPLLTGAYAEASPITYVSAEDAPMLIYHAVDDPTIPKQNAERMFATLQAARVPAKLFMRESGGHEPPFDIDEVDRWLRQYLKR